MEQDPGPGEMQITVLDDASPDVDIETIAKATASDRIEFVRSEKNRGLAGSWNHCIEHARGKWVHILHQDDYVLHGFYRRIEQAALEHPEAALIATRSFLMNSAGIIEDISPRIPNLESGGKAASPLYYGTLLPCPGVTVRRDFYEQFGGFRSDLAFTLDIEMWTRAIAQCGGVVLPDVLAAYRFSNKNETSRLVRSGEAFEDRNRLLRLLAERYADIDLPRAQREICWSALAQMRQARQTGDREGAAVSLAYWKKHASAGQKLRRLVGGLVRMGRKTLG